MSIDVAMPDLKTQPTPILDKEADSTPKPFMARGAEVVYTPFGSTSMQNPDTSTYNHNTEDNDT